MSSTTGEIIYKAFSPNYKILGCVALGYIIVKIGIFTPASAKGVSILAINVSLPALIFSSIVTAFTPDNISAFGSLAMVAILYQVLGLSLALVVREIFYVPMDFQWGILVMGCTSNWGNLPIAIVQTLGLKPPFRGQVDVDLGIAYDSAFVLIMNTLFFPLGLHKLCALDFREANLSRPPRAPFRERWGNRLRRLRRTEQKEAEENLELSDTSDAQVIEEEPAESPRLEKQRPSTSSDHGEHGEEPAELSKRVVRYESIQRKTSRASSFTSMLENTRPIPFTAPLDAPEPSRSTAVLPTHLDSGPAYHEPPTPAPSVHTVPWHTRLLKLASNFLMPTTIALVSALPCALIQPLKALFTPVDGWTGTRVPNAPDDKPPLAFVLDTATFLGAITVPASLILLGAGIARLQKPASWRSLPTPAIIAMTTCKMILLPVFGIFLVQGLRDHTNLYPPEDKMRIFLAIICSGTPTAINQLVVTQLYNPAGTAHTLAMFLALQYAMMPILSTACAGIALYVVER